MNYYSDNLGRKITNLVDKNYEAERGFIKAADYAKHRNLKSYFIDKAKERLDFGHELALELRNNGCARHGKIPYLNKANCSWMALKSWFSVKDDGAMLQEAIRGEKASVAEYDEVLNDTTLPKSTKEVLEIQKNTVAHSLINIKTLDDLI